MRDKNFSVGNIHLKKSSGQVPTNIQTALQGFQSSGIKRLAGTETIEDMIQPSSHDTGFWFFKGWSLNPAEPATTPMLAAQATQFARFTTGPLGITFTPSASATRDGQLIVAVIPNPEDQTPPDSLEEMRSKYGAVVWPIYGQANSLHLDPRTLQQAYRVQEVKTYEKVADDTALNSSGWLMVATNGVAAGTHMGSLDLSYNYSVDVPKLTVGSNVVDGVYLLSGARLGSHNILCHEDDLTKGYQTLIRQDARAHTFRVKCAKHRLVVVTELAVAGTLALETSADAGTTWVALAATSSLHSGVYGVDLWEDVPGHSWIRMTATQNTVSARVSVMAHRS